MAYQNKSRDTAILSQRNRFNITSAMRDNWNQFCEQSGRIADCLDQPPPGTGGLNTLEEERLDGFVVLDGETGRFSWETGLRYETTDVSITDLTVAAADQNKSTDYAFFLPSATSSST